MRGIGNGQTLLVLVTPEVLRLVADAMALSPADAPKRLEQLQVVLRKGAAEQDQDGPLLRDVAGWLVLNGMRSEEIQSNLLNEQNLRNVWRKNAYRELCGDARRRIGSQSTTLRDRECLNAFRECLDYRVENTIPAPVLFHAKLTNLARINESLLCGDLDKQVVAYVLGQADPALAGTESDSVVR